MTLSVLLRLLIRYVVPLLLLTLSVSWLRAVVGVQSATPYDDGAPGEWRRSNPGGGGAFAAVGAGPTGIILVASDQAGAYRSLDRSETWQIIGAAAGLSTTHVSSVGFDRQEGAILYLGTDQGIFRSQDGGATVQQVLNIGEIADLRFAASDANRGYAAWHSSVKASDGQVYKSSDRGKSWQIVSTNLPDPLRILKLLIDPSNANLVYLLAGEGRLACSAPALYRSQDGGVTWSQLAAPLGQVQDVALAGNAASTSLFFTTYDDVWDDDYTCVSDDAQGGNLYRSDNGGEDWTKIAQHTGAIWLDRDDAHAIRLIEPDHQTPGDGRNGVWESTDNGASWRQISTLTAWEAGWASLTDAYRSNFEGIARTLGEDLSDPDTLFWATPHFIFVTRDNGYSFQNLYTRQPTAGHWQSRGVDNVYPLAITIGAASVNTVTRSGASQLYVGYHDIGCWRSEDVGVSWQNCSYSVTDNSTSDTVTLLADPNRAGVVWSGQAHGLVAPFTLLRSVDGGREWSEANAGLSERLLMGLSLDPNSPLSQRTLFVTSGGDVYSSSNDGATWSKRFDCNGCRVTAVDYFERDLVYAGGERGLWRSQRSGEVGSWHQIGAPEIDGNGDNNPFGADWQGVSAIAPDPLHNLWLYVVVHGPDQGLYRSQDGGESWQKIFLHSSLRQVAISPWNAGQLYVTAASARLTGHQQASAGGVWRSLDGGQSWSQVNAGLDWPLVAPLAFDLHHPNLLWIGGVGAGLYWRDFGNGATPTPVPSMTATVVITATPPAAMPTLTPDLNTPQPNISGIAGRVSDQQDSALAGIRVTVYRLKNGDWRKVAKTFTDGEGRYRIENLSVAPHRVRFSADERIGQELYRKEYFNNTNRLSQATDVEVLAGEITDNVDAQLASTMTPTAEIDGDIAYQVEADSGQLTILAWPGSELTVERRLACATAESVSNAKIVVGDSTFAMQVVDEEAQQYRVKLSVPGDLSVGRRLAMTLQWRCNRAARQIDRTYDIAVGQIEIAESKPAGQVMDAVDEKPVVGASVTLHRIPGWRPRTSSTDLAENTCESLVSKPPEAPWSQTASEDLGEEVEPTESETLINPQITGRAGRSLWKVTQGCWYLVVTAQGYVTGLSPVVGVDGGVLDVGVLVTPVRAVYLPLVAR